MVLTSLMLGLVMQGAGIGQSASDRIQTCVQLLGATHEAVQDKVGRPNSIVQGNAVWIYGPWTPSPRIGFSVSYFYEDSGDQVLGDGVEFILGSASSVKAKTLTVQGGKSVPKDFCWTSGESTPDVISSLKATDVKYFAQKKNPNYVLTTCTVSGHPVYLFSRQISGDTIVPVFKSNGDPDFDPKRLDFYSFSVGYCSFWHYTAGFSEADISGPGSYADKSLATDPWVTLTGS